MSEGLVRLVWAEDADGVIGVGGGLPWQLPADLARFKRLTLGGTVVMGSGTWVSLPVKPLPGRVNIVLSSQGVECFPGADRVVSSVGEVLGLGDVWVIGGSQVYDQLLPFADELYVTVVDARVDGDVSGVVFGPDRGVVGDLFEQVEVSDVLVDEASGVGFRFVKLVKKH